MSPVTVKAPFSMLTTEMVPLAMLPVGYSATTGVPLEYSMEVVRGSDPAGLVGDVGGLAVRRDHDAVRNVADADFRSSWPASSARSILASVSLLSSTTYAVVASDETAIPMG